MNGKKLLNLAAPTAASDAATKAYVDAIRTFNTAIILSGAYPQARIAFTAPDLSFGAKEAGSQTANSLNRWCWNDNTTMTGTDVAILDETGQPSFLGANIMSNMAMVSGNTFVAMSTGFAGIWQFNKADGSWTMYSTAASVAGGAAAVPTVVARFNMPTGTTLTDAAFLYGPAAGGPIYHQNRGVSAGYYRQAGVGNFSWSKSANGLQSGASLTELMTLDDAGNLVLALGSYGSTTTGGFVGTTTVAILASAGAGTVYLRPNGRISTTGQTTVDSGGNMIVAGSFTSGGNITAPANFISSTGAAILANNGTVGAVYLRPNGAGSTTGETYVTSAGDMRVNGSVNCTAVASSGAVSSSGQFISTTTNATVAGAGGAVFLRPKGVADATAQGYVDNAGSFYITGPTGQKATAGSWTAPSDIRLKDVHGDYEHGLAELLQIQPVRYAYKAQPQLGEIVGLIAQDIEGVFPECVTQGDGEIDGEPVTDLRMFDPTSLTYALINAVKELSARVAALEAK